MTEYAIHEHGSAYGDSPGPSTTRYYPIAGSFEWWQGWATEAQAQTRIRDTFTGSKFFVRITSNNLTGSTTVRTRKNGANGSCSVSIPASSTGTFEDTTNSDSLVAGDLYDYQFVAGAGTSIWVSILAITLSHASALEQILVATAYNTGQVYGTTYYNPLNGYLRHTLIESQVQVGPKFAGSLSKLRCYVTQNSLNSASTLRTRKNGSNGAQSVSIPATSTGAFEDTTNSDSFASGDLLNTQLVAGGVSAQTITISNVQVMLTSGHLHMSSGSTAGTATLYGVLGGDLYPYSIESYSLITSRISTTRKNLYVSVHSNNRNGSVTVKTRKNGSDGNLSVSIPASTTGVFEDTTHTDTIASGDTVCNCRVVGGSSGSCYIGIISTNYDAVYSFTVTDSGSGADTPSPQAEMTITDLNTSVIDAAALEGQIAPVDSGAGADNVPSLQAELTITESGAGDDVPTVQVEFTVTDSGVDTDVIAIEAQFAIQDSGVGSEWVEVTEFGIVNVYDSGSGVDVWNLEAALSFSDAGVGEDAWSAEYTIPITDAGAGDEAVLVESSFTITDLGAGSDAADLQGQITSEDSVLGSEADVEISFSIGDAGEGVDIFGLEAQISKTDSGEGIDVWSATYTIPADDSGVGSEQVDMQAQVPVEDAGIGSDVIVSIAFTIADAGVGDDVWIYPEASLTVTDEGSGSDVVDSISVSFTVEDSGLGDDVWALVAQISAADSSVGTDVWEYPSASIPVSDTGICADAPTILVSFTISETGAGAEVVSCGYSIPVYDSGVGTEYFSKEFPVIECAIGVDVTYRILDEISLDGVALPHVLSISVAEPSILQDLPVMDALPYRKQLGKRGRSLTIRGWTDSLSTLETLRAYADGEQHLLLLPTGDSMYVLISDVRTPENVENYDRYDYEIDAAEVID